jgi:hypothetical protein
LWRGMQEAQGQGLLIGIIVLILTLIAVFCGFRYWCWPRTICYRWFCELMQQDLELKTSTWLERESDHFRVKYQPGDAVQVPLVLESVEEVYLPVSKRLQYFPAKKIPIVMYPDREALGKSFGGTSDQNTMGAYWAGIIRVLAPRQWIYTNDPAEIMRVFKAEGPLAHEYAHLLIDCRSRGNYPRWLTEGIAQYVEREVTGFALKPLPQEESGNWYRLSEMDAGFDSLPNQELAYRQSLVVTEYLIAQHDFATVLRVLDRLGEGKSLKHALASEMSTNIVKLEAGFRRWVNTKYVEKE